MSLRNGKRSSWKKSKNKVDNQCFMKKDLTKFRFCPIFVISFEKGYNTNNNIQ